MVNVNGHGREFYNDCVLKDVCQYVTHRIPKPFTFTRDTSGGRYCYDMINAKRSLYLYD